MQRIKVKAYAKINLALDVLGRRNDGFHELESVMQGISLYDQVELEMLGTPGILLECPYPETGPPEDNLAYRAAKLLQGKYGCKQGVRITIHKAIPAAAGLAGGSADGAAVLLGLNKLFSLGLSRDSLYYLASELGSDVPFCLWPATAMAAGRGERISQLPSPPPLWLVLCKPAYAVSTADVYHNLKNVQITLRPDIPGLVAELLEKKDPLRAYPKMVNVLEYSTFELFPQLREEAKELESLGALRVMMAGSGPTLAAFAGGEREAWELSEKWSKGDWEKIVARTLVPDDLRERAELYE